MFELDQKEGHRPCTCEEECYKVLEAEPSKKARPSGEGQDEERQGHVHKDFVKLS